MATLLDVVNNVMRRVRLIDSQDEVLLDFDDNRLRVDVDMIIDAVNDTIRYIYDYGKIPPHVVQTGTITLSATQRGYNAPDDFHRMVSESFIDQVKGHRLCEYPGGFKQLFEDQLVPDNYQGQPLYWAISPSKNIRLDKVPGPEFDGDEYSFLYEAQLNFVLHTDVLPMSEMTIRDMTPAIVQMYKKDSDPTSYDSNAFMSSVAMAVASLHAQPIRPTYV